MVTSRIVFLRHARTAGNGPGDDSPMAGWTDLPLSDEGRMELRSVAAHFDARAFAAIYASPLRRARETADALARDVRIRAALREIHCGEVDGWTIARVKRELPQLWEANLRQDDDAFRWPGGESYREFRERVRGAIEVLAGAHEGERILVVTHAGVIGQAVGMALGTPPARWGAHRPENLTLTELARDDRGLSVVRFGERISIDPRSRGAGIGPAHDS